MRQHQQFMEIKISSFTEENFIPICNELIQNDPDLKLIIDQYGYPPIWKRAASFETIIHIILEQQVSLASALATLKKLKEKIINVTPQNVLALSNEELKNCYFSRQKILYVQHLANVILAGQLDLISLAEKDNDTVRSELTKIKGIGNWSVDVFLMMVLQRADLFPLGDIALIKSVRETKHLSKEIPKETIADIAAKWKPYQTIAAFILWHGYLKKRNR